MPISSSIVRLLTDLDRDLLQMRIPGVDAETMVDLDDRDHSPPSSRRISLLPGAVAKHRRADLVREVEAFVHGRAGR